MAIFMNSFSNMVPNALIMHLKHNKLIHEHVIFLSIIINDVTKIKKDANYVFSDVLNIKTILHGIEKI
ncbi:MAG: KUP/HAK/KT family potassium transporter [Rickettsiales endosymbiont of Dermacentor nuttalli]